MKIFLLVITFWLLIGRIKSTPRMLNKTLYMRDLQKLLNEQNETFSSHDKEYVDTIKGLSVLALTVSGSLTMIYYMLIGSRFSSDMLMLILSALQIVSVMITFKRNFTNRMFSPNIEDYKFYRWYFLFNVILDYIYYPLTIYMLLK